MVKSKSKGKKKKNVSPGDVSIFDSQENSQENSIQGSSDAKKNNT